MNKDTFILFVYYYLQKTTNIKAIRNIHTIQQFRNYRSNGIKELQNCILNKKSSNSTQPITMYFENNISEKEIKTITAKLKLDTRIY